MGTAVRGLGSLTSSPRRGVVRFLALALALVLTGCSPTFVVKAGIAQARILSARQPIAEALQDPELDPEIQGKLVLTLEARDFAAGSLGIETGDSYTTFARLDRDTLALVLSAAHPDRLEARTWWFPVAGRVPYRAYFSSDDALREQRSLEEEGLDTYLRPTPAFSTLGWFADPLLSTVLAQDEVGVVTTVLHELGHNHLYLPGRTLFNESYATFVGGAGAAAFFCGREGGGPDTVWCRRARDRWADAREFSRFIDGLVKRLTSVYSEPGLSREAKLERRDEVFRSARETFAEEIQPRFRASTFQSFLDVPLNNATLMARMRYYHRLPDFQAFLEGHGGDLFAALRTLKREAPARDDPFEILPRKSAEDVDGDRLRSHRPGSPDPPSSPTTPGVGEGDGAAPPSSVVPEGKVP